MVTQLLSNSVSAYELHQRWTSIFVYYWRFDVTKLSHLDWLLKTNF